MNVFKAKVNLVGTWPSLWIEHFVHIKAPLWEVPPPDIFKEGFYHVKLDFSQLWIDAIHYCLQSKLVVVHVSEVNSILAFVFFNSFALAPPTHFY